MQRCLCFRLTFELASRKLLPRNITRHTSAFFNLALLKTHQWIYDHCILRRSAQPVAGSASPFRTLAGITPRRSRLSAVAPRDHYPPPPRHVDRRPYQAFRNSRQSYTSFPMDLLPPLNLYLRQGDPYSPRTPSAGFDFRRISALPLSRRPTESVPLVSSAASPVLPASFRLTDYLI